jgi:hypothetical protein
MVRSVVAQVAALTEATQVAQPVVGRIVVQVCGGEHHARRTQPRHLLEVGPAGGAAAPVAPCLPRRIKPPPVRQAAHGGPVRSAAALAYAPAARSKRMRRLSSCQWAGYRPRRSRRIGIASPPSPRPPAATGGGLWRRQQSRRLFPPAVSVLAQVVTLARQ